METTNRVEYAEIKSRLIALRRVSRVMKGGKRYRFSALVAVGDGNGRVGAALGKAQDTSSAISKAEERAKRNMIKIPIVQNGTIPHEIIGECGAARILLKPAGPGTGIIANQRVRILLELAGLKNVIAKSLGSNNIINLTWATLDGLSKLRTKEEIYQTRFAPLPEEEKPKPMKRKPRKKEKERAQVQKEKEE